jgi:TonB family protein
MRTIFLVALIGLTTTVRNSVAQGYTPTYDHSIAVLELAPEERGKGRALPISLPLPPYPAEMLRAHIRGEATIRFLIQEDGTVTDVSVVSTTQREFGDPVKESATRWRFRPLDQRGVPVAVRVWMKCRVVFKIEED